VAKMFLVGLIKRFELLDEQAREIELVNGSVRRLQGKYQVRIRMVQEWAMLGLGR